MPYTSELHHEAYNNIVSSRRSIVDTADGEQIDVHGLHVDEALDFISRRVNGMCCRCSFVHWGQRVVVTALTRVLSMHVRISDIQQRLADPTHAAKMKRSRAGTGPFLLDIVCGTGHHSVKGMSSLGSRPACGCLCNYLTYATAEASLFGSAGILNTCMCIHMH